MKDLEKRFAALGVAIPEILLPKEGTDMAKWAVIACDQFSSDKSYWEDVNKLAGSSPSALNLILPECYLGERELPEQVAGINSVMKEYIDQGVFQALRPGFILVERKVENLPVRQGIVLSVDLEQYDFREGTKSLIRPTEGTILDRLPPRIQIREGAALDLPHILFLIDDPEMTVIEKAAEQKEKMDLLYDIELMKGGGRVTGRKIDDPVMLGDIASALEKLGENKDLLFAVGDGNHSLAAAKSIWERIKSRGGDNVMNHPARWALVEVENIYNPGLVFEPIHRVLFDARPEVFLEQIGKLPSCRVEDEQDRLNTAEDDGEYRIRFITENRTGKVIIEKGSTTLAAEGLQSVLDDYIEKNTGIEIDYIHGDEAVEELARKPGNIGFYLPPLDKGEFFAIIMEKGPMPRKTFSLGEAEGKRYYLEARKLIP